MIFLFLNQATSFRSPRFQIEKIQIPLLLLRVKNGSFSVRVPRRAEKWVLSNRPPDDTATSLTERLPCAGLCVGFERMVLLFVITV